MSASTQPMPYLLPLLILSGIVVALAVLFSLFLDQARTFELLPAKTQPEGTVDVTSPPAGVSFEKTVDGFVLSASTRAALLYDQHVRGYVFWFAFLIPWSCVALPVLVVFPAVGVLIDAFTQTALVRIPVLVCFGVFTLPALYVLYHSWRQALMSAWGRVTITVEGDVGRIFAGLGSWGRTEVFSRHEVSEVYESRRHWSDPRGMRAGIVLQSGQKRIKFGQYPLSEARRTFIVGVLRQMLRTR
jgi:hypothetical protein